MKTICCLMIVTACLAMACGGDDPADGTGTPGQPLPVGLSIFSGVATDFLHLKWTASSGATNYRVETGIVAAGPFSVLANTAALGYTHTGLAPGVTNQYRVVAEGPGGESLANPVVAGFTGVVRVPAVGTATNYQTNAGFIWTHDPYRETPADNELVILTLNMHTYQESGQDEKFDMIVRLIAEAGVDFALLQENAQHRNSPLVYGAIKADNMCVVLTNRLKQYYGLDYYFTWDWAHYGWSVWEEGNAVLSRYPLTATESRWVSTVQSSSSLVSRKAVYGRAFATRAAVTVNLVSTHLHWRTSESDPEPAVQASNVKALVTANLAGADLSLVGGDYNAQALEADTWGISYKTMVQDGEYVDTFLMMHPDANNPPRNPVYDTVKGTYPGRIDYIFMRTNASFGVVSSQIIFTPTILGTVSDHYGVLTRLRKAP